MLYEMEGPDPDEQIPCDPHNSLPDIGRLPDCWLAILPGMTLRLGRHRKITAYSS